MKFARRLSPYFEIAALFVIAAVLRIAFNLSLESRLCHFGDAYHFLTSGAQLLAAIKSGMISQLAAMHPQATVGVNAMMSHSLVDRILIDGPVFPGYLALVQFAVGLNPASPQFDAHSLQIAICNSLLDATACVLIYQMARLAFDRTTGRIAGVFAAFYPAAIINTASCYSEPFAYFVIALFFATLFATGLRQTNKVVSHLIANALGLSAALLMLAKPVFVALPFIAFAISLALCDKLSIRRNWTIGATTLITLAVALAPWLAFTGAVTGKSSIVVNRYPAFNFMMGNRLSSDGWRDYPLPYIPTEMSEALQLVRADFEREPARFAAMEVRKFIRLWAGSWNNFELSFVLSPEWQDRLHQLLLAAGLLGFVGAISHNRLRSRVGRSALILGAVPLFHCVYMIFEPQSRYAFPAMPAVIALAAYAFSALFRPTLSLRPRGPFAHATIAAATIWLLIVIAAEAAYYPNRFERTVSQDKAQRIIYLSDAQASGYILVDAKAFRPKVMLNGHQLPEPVPFWQLHEGTEELVNAMSIQAAGMGKPMQQFRQWWAYPARLRSGQNKVEVLGTVYGDTPDAYSGDRAWLPALERGSWTQAFTTIHRHEPRIYTNVSLADNNKRGEITPRIFFLPSREMSSKPAHVLALLDRPKTIVGADPTSYALTQKPITLTPHLDRFRFSADVQSPKGAGAGFASVILTATVNGKPKEWSSPWQPTRISASTKPTRWTFEDEIPSDIANATDAKARVIISPFTADLLFLNKRAALKRALIVNGARLEFYPLGAYPSVDAPFQLR